MIAYKKKVIQYRKDILVKSKKIKNIYTVSC